MTTPSTFPLRIAGPKTQWTIWIWSWSAWTPSSWRFAKTLENENWTKILATYSSGYNIFVVEIKPKHKTKNLKEKESQKYPGLWGYRRYFCTYQQEIVCWRGGVFITYDHRKAVPESFLEGFGLKDKPNVTELYKPAASAWNTNDSLQSSSVL